MMGNVMIYNCTDSNVINKITSLSKEFSELPLNNRTWAYKKLHQNIFEILAEKGYLNAKLGYSMYVLRGIEDKDNVPCVITYKRLTDDKKYIVIVFDAEIAPES